MKTLHFLAGLPRSGSTVLVSILNQHPKIKATTTSGLIDLLGSICTTWENSPNTLAANEKVENVYPLLRSLIAGKYNKESKPIIVDKSRGWADSAIINTMEKVLETRPKIIATVRHPADCAASFVRLVKPVDVSSFLNFSPYIDHLKKSYATLQAGYAHHPDCFLFVDYDDLIKNPKKEMNKVLKFLELPSYSFDFNNLNTEIVSENDEIWGVKNLHKIDSVLRKQHKDNSKDILQGCYDSFDPPRFWKGESFKPKKIDESLALSLKGKVKEAYKVLCEAQKENPVCNRIAFNMGWFLLSKGKLKQGMECLTRGRFDRCFGNLKPAVNSQIWNGESKGTILYYLEGGLGDQIHAMKYIEDIKLRGCEVIVACSSELISTVKTSFNVKAIIQHEAASAIAHDWWVPSMSVLLPLGYEYSDINGKAYIPKIKTLKSNKKLTIGVRWWGNPQFEHEQYRRFPLKLFFDSLKNVDAEFISLQRDAGAEETPSWIKNVNLDSWETTRKEISKCDLVISSCTSVAHMSAAMGVDTWILVPILPYYLWALPGDKTPYYDSVRLFRQTKYNCWKGTMKKLAVELKKYKPRRLS